MEVTAGPLDAVMVPTLVRLGSGEDGRDGGSWIVEVVAGTASAGGGVVSLVMAG